MLLRFRLTTTDEIVFEYYTDVIPRDRDIILFTPPNAKKAVRYIVFGGATHIVTPQAYETIEEGGGTGRKRIFANSEYIPTVDVRGSVL